MATNEKRRDKSGESQDVTTWFRITLWGKQAENASKYLTKGSNVYIEGRLRVEEWSDRDGKSRYTLDVHATDMQFIGTRSGDEMSGGAGSAGGGYSQNDFGDDTHSDGAGVSSGGSSMPTDDDIPF
jgi:single-strand DNA-binding protein